MGILLKLLKIFFFGFLQIVPYEFIHIQQFFYLLKRIQYGNIFVYKFEQIHSSQTMSQGLWKTHFFYE